MKKESSSSSAGSLPKGDVPVVVSGDKIQVPSKET